MLSVGTFNDESDIEDASSHPGLDSPGYSDQINSDVEIELYNRVHHTILDKNTNFVDVFNDRGTGVHNSRQNGFCNHHAPNVKSVINEVVHTKTSDIKQEVRTGTLKVKQEVRTETLLVKQAPKVQNGLLLKKTKASPNINHAETFFSDVSRSETTDESSNSDVNLFYVDECGPSDDDLLINIKGGRSNLDVRSAFSFKASNCSDEDVIYIDNTSNKKVNKPIQRRKKRKSKFQPITIDIEDSSDFSSSEEIQLSPIKLRKRDVSKMENDSWHLDPEDKYQPKKYIQRYHDEKQKCKNCGEWHKVKFCPKARSLKCYICGDDHKSAFCTKKVCSFCYQLGHNYKKCPNKNEVNQRQCEICKLSGHTFNLCPDLWRRFHATTTPSKAIVQLQMSASNSDRIFCYNCGLSGHFGYQCLYSPSRISSSPSWPYVVSYKNPQNLLRYESAIVQGSKSPRKKYLANNRKRKCANQEVSTPLNSGQTFRKNKGSFLKKKKLFYQEQNFLRSPSSGETTGANNQMNSRKKKRKRQKKANMHCMSQNYTV